MVDSCCANSKRYVACHAEFSRFIAIWYSELISCEVSHCSWPDQPLMCTERCYSFENWFARKNLYSLVISWTKCCNRCWSCDWNDMHVVDKGEDMLSRMSQLLQYVSQREPSYARFWFLVYPNCSFATKSETSNWVYAAWCEHIWGLLSLIWTTQKYIEESSKSLLWRLMLEYEQRPSISCQRQQVMTIERTLLVPFLERIT